MTTTTQPLSLGEMLAQAREARGVSLEQAAHHTKIRPSQLREMEKDNTFYFSHPSYARLFLRDYAKYLGLPLSRIDEFLPDAGEFSSVGMEYLQDYSKVEKSGMTLRQMASIGRSSPLSFLTAAAAVLLLAALCFYGWHAHKGSETAATPKSENTIVANKNLDRVADKNFLNATAVGEENAVPVSSVKTADPTSASDADKSSESGKAPENAKVGGPLALAQPAPHAVSTSSGKSQ